jgi:hypothetical protein
MEGPAGCDQNGQRDKRDRGEGGREDHQHGHREHDLQPAADDLDQRLPQKLVQRLHVRGQARDEHAGSLLLEEAERQRLQLVERGPAQPVQEALARGRGQQRLGADDERLHGCQAEDGERCDVERTLVVLSDAVVDGIAHERRPGQRDQRREDHGRGCEQVQALNWAHELARLVPDLPRRCALHQAAWLSSASRAR